jgi:hypothetical protein
MKYGRPPKKVPAKSAAKAGSRSAAPAMVPMKTAISGHSKQAPAAAKKAAVKNRAFKHYTLTPEAGSHIIFDTPLRPRHLTEEQIASAIADLD